MNRTIERYREPLEHAYEAMTEAGNQMQRGEWEQAAHSLTEARGFVDQAENGDLKDEAEAMLARYWAQFSR